MTTETPSEDKAGAVEVEGAQLGYRIEGHGEPCLVVGSSVYYPRVFSQDLRDHLRLVFVDLRPFATSDPSFDRERISIETYANDIERVMQTLELGEAVVIGHSIHGLLALEYARRYPEHVRGVVVIGTPPYRPDEVELGARPEVAVCLDLADRLVDRDRCVVTLALQVLGPAQAAEPVEVFRALLFLLVYAGSSLRASCGPVRARTTRTSAVLRGEQELAKTAECRFRFSC